jgi:sugar diacid utilization regulator
MSTALESSVRSLQAFGVVPAVAVTLRATITDVAQQLEHDVTTNVEAFTHSANPDLAPELQQHLQQLLGSICDTLTIHGAGDFKFARQYAKRRAEQKFPLEALLGSLALSHHSLLPWLRDASLTVATESAQMNRVVSAVNTFLGHYFSHISSLMTAEYVQRTRDFAEVESDRRTELFNLLLQGYDESDNYAAALLRRAGYLEQRQSFCIVLAQSVEPREMENRARAQRMADALDEVLKDMPVRALTSVRDNLVTVVVSGRQRQSGWTAAQSLLADRILPHLRQIGPAALIGISTDVPSTAHIPRALREARLALNLASVSDRVLLFSRIPFHKILVHVASAEIQPALPAWLGPFLDSNRKSRGALLTTLQAYANSNMNVLRTAKLLSLHPNTIYARLQKIEDLTGQNALSYNALTELLLATECVQSRYGELS